MSVIAGIVPLTRRRMSSEPELLAMLKAMAPSLEHRIETYSAPDAIAMVGRVAYAPDAGEASGTCGSATRLWALGVGELYNDEYAGRTAMVDALTDRYERLGWREFARGLNGSFAAVVVDPSQRSVTLVTDHTASCPVFSMIHDDVLYFASEVKGLMAVEDLPCDADAHTILALLTNGFFLGRNTLVRGVEQMDYATVCHVAPGKIDTVPYWRYHIEQTDQRNPKELLTDLQRLLCTATDRRSRMGRVSMALSGGVDSRGIAACLRNPADIQSFTYTSQSLATRHKYSDWALAERTAQIVGMPHSAFFYRLEDFAGAMSESIRASDGAAGFIYENVWADVREATKTDYCLCGDECLGWVRGPIPAEQVPHRLEVFPLSGQPEAQKCLQQDRLADFLTLSTEALQEAMSHATANSPQDQVDELYLDQRLINCLNAKRRVLARVGLFPRNPWLDLDVMEFMRKIPSRWRLGKSLFRKALAKISPALCALPQARRAEHGTYLAHFRAVEQNDRFISRWIYDANPLLEEFLDAAAVQRVIDVVCGGQSRSNDRPRFSLKESLPVSVRLWLGSLKARYRPATGEQPAFGRLLRLMTIAAALRMLHNRFQQS